MYVCQCEVITDRQVATAIAGGCTTVASVCRQTGAGSGCGQCITTVRDLLCAACPLADGLVEPIVTPAA